MKFKFICENCRYIIEKETQTTEESYKYTNLCNPDFAKKKVKCPKCESENCQWFSPTSIVEAKKIIELKKWKEKMDSKTT